MLSGVLMELSGIYRLAWLVARLSAFGFVDQTNVTGTEYFKDMVLRDKKSYFSCMSPTV